MKLNRKNIMMTFLLGMSILSGCANSPADSANESADNHINEVSANNERKDENQQSIDNENSTGANDLNTTEDLKEENDAISHSDENSTESSKIENESAISSKDLYLQKLNDTKKEVDKWEATDFSTYALKEIENKRWETWDDLLNELYGVLQKELSEEEMEALREEQIKWIEYRDNTALEASEEYKGGTQEHLEYVAVLANLTEERCYELVEDYM